MTAEEIRDQLASAREAATGVARRAPLGLRAVEPGRGRWYLCAFEGPAFLCLTDALAPEGSSRTARDVAAAGLLVERLEQYVDAGRLRALAESASRSVARGDEDVATTDALVLLAQQCLDLAAWMEAPERAIASIADLDAASLYHEQMRAAYGRFVSATEGLVAVQDTLDADRIAALLAVEQAAGEAEIGENLARRLGAAMEDCDAAAAEVVAAHITRFAE